MKKDKIHKDTYNRIAHIYTDKHFATSPFNDSMQYFVDNLPKNADVLDLACGPGQYSGLLQSKGFNVTGIDFSEEMLKIARERIPNVKFVKGNILTYPFDKHKYDGVWANAILLHFNTVEVRKILKKIYRALAPGGLVLISFLEGEKKRKFERVDRGVYDLRYFYDRTKENVGKLLRDNSFEPVSYCRMPGEKVTFFYFVGKKI